MPFWAVIPDRTMHADNQPNCLTNLNRFVGWARKRICLSANFREAAMNQKPKPYISSRE
jgi:hypothetical protein